MSYCEEIRAQFSEYLDGAVDGTAMQAIAAHLERCRECHQEFAAWRDMQASLAVLGPAKAPADLALRLRVAISHERARTQRTLFHGLDLLWQDTVGPVLLRAAAGLASTIVLLGTGALLLGLLSTPVPLVADDQTSNTTSPRYLYSSVQPHPMVLDHDGIVLVEAFVDGQGHIYDYRILSGPDTPQIRTAIADRLLFSVYEPARFFGQPVRGRVLLSFAGISVHG